MVPSDSVRATLSCPHSLGEEPVGAAGTFITVYWIQIKRSKPAVEGLTTSLRRHTYGQVTDRQALGGER